MHTAYKFSGERHPAIDCVTGLHQPKRRRQRTRLAHTAAMTTTRKLLVLDLDETLIHARETPLAHAEDFRALDYFVYRRPQLTPFLDAVAQHFDLGVWTSSGHVYAQAVVEQVLAPYPLRFVWSNRRCTLVRDWPSDRQVELKSLAKLKRHGWSLDDIVAVDDTPAKHARNYGNLVAVSEFRGEPADQELQLLALYLPTLAQLPSVRQVEKRNWREQALRLQRPSA